MPQPSHNMGRAQTWTIDAGSGHPPSEDRNWCGGCSRATRRDIVRAQILMAECSLTKDQLMTPKLAVKQPASEIHTPQNNADHIHNCNAATRMKSVSKDMMAGDRTLWRCSSLEINEVKSSAGDSTFSTCSAPMKVDNLNVSTATVKDGIPHAKSLEEKRHELGSSTDPEAKERQRQSTASQHGDKRCQKRARLSEMTWGSSHLLQAIINKHGDISKECTLESEFYRNFCSEGICRVVQKLQETRFADLHTDELKEFYLIVQDAKSVNLDVRWLHQRLDEIAESMRSRDEIERLEETERENEAARKALEMKRVEVQNLENEIQEIEKEQASEKLRVEELKAQIKYIKSTCRDFHSLLDGLF